MIAPEEVPAVTPNTSAPTGTEPTSTNSTVVGNESAVIGTENAPAEASGPDAVDQSAGNVETEDAPVASTPVFALPAELTPAILRLVTAAAQLQKTQGTENLTPQKRK